MPQYKNDKLLIDEAYTRVKPSCFDENKIIKDDKGNLYYPFNDKLLEIHHLSDGYFSDFEKDILSDKVLRAENESVRSLRIAASHLIPGAKLLIVLADELKSLVQYEKNKVTYIIDYANNIIMKKEDYDKLFSYDILEEIPQYEMPYLKDLTRSLSDILPPHLLILFYSEIKMSLKNKGTNLFPDKYIAGIHANNRHMLDLDAEILFTVKEEKRDIWLPDADVIYSFTLNDLSRNFPISITEDDYFLYKDYKFRRLSDYTSFVSYKEELLSSQRYHKCMIRSLNVIFSLAKTLNKDNLRLVLGKTPINELESFYHAWVEFKSKSLGCYIAIDYTGNLIIKSEDFIRLRDAQVIDILSFDLLDELFTYYDASLIGIDKFPTLFFAEEFLSDYKKNKGLYKNIND